MGRLRYNQQSGLLGASLTSGATGITFAVAPGFATLVSPDYIPITIDGEVVHLTAFTAAATTGTIARGQEGTPAASHLNGAAWEHAPTVSDFFKRRVATVTQSATPAILTDNIDEVSITGLAQAITSMTTNLTGTPEDGDRLSIRLTDNGTARAITWGAKFEASTVSLPTTTVISTMLIVHFMWNIATSKWRCIGAI